VTAITPDAFEQQALSRDSGLERSRPSRRALARLWHPLAAICAVQAALCMVLVYSNTAYIDEADYLWIGHLVLGNWLHGHPWPASEANRNLSGSPVIYPPLGALADSAGGLAGARILSLLFMLGATILLFSVASRLIGHRAAVIAAFLWALSEPALRLAYATYDPLSVFLTTVSAWLIVQAAYRRHRPAYVVLAAVALAVANATAYSGIVIDPVVVGFAFAVWLPVMRARWALAAAAALGVGVVVSLTLVLIGTGSASGTTAVFNRQSQDHETLGLVMAEIWSYSGLIIALALIGALLAIKIENRQRALLMVLLAVAVFTAPAAQFHYGTAWSADKHVAYGFWFAVMAAGYGCDKLIGWPAGARRGLIACCCALALVYPAAYGFQAAWQRYHLWPNSTAFITALRPVLAHSSGLIYVPGHEANIAQYYLPAGRDWTRWSAALALDPSGLPVPVPRSQWGSYYQSRVSDGRYGVIAIFYDTTFTASPSLPGNLLARGGVTQAELLDLVGANSDELGVPILTRTLAKSGKYRLMAVGPYNINNLSGTHSYGVFAIWKRVAAK
jgi:hypothetical protein